MKDSTLIGFMRFLEIEYPEEHRRLSAYIKWLEADASPPAAVAVTDGWLPIESAPKDAPTHSIMVLVYLPEYGVRLGQYTRYCADKGEWPWLAEGFSGAAGRTITHWMPRPAPPTSSAQSAGGLDA